MQKTSIQTLNAEETQSLGASYAVKVKNGGILLLYGDLGGGKTTFTQGLAKQLGVDRPITSPTYILLRSYQVPANNEGKFYHLDLYRIKTEHDVRALGIDEIFENKRNIIVIEWADKLQSLFPQKRTELHFTYVSDTIRHIEEKIYG